MVLITGSSGPARVWGHVKSIYSAEELTEGLRVQRTMNKHGTVALPSRRMSSYYFHWKGKDLRKEKWPYVVRDRQVTPKRVDYIAPKKSVHVPLNRLGRRKRSKFVLGQPSPARIRPSVVYGSDPMYTIAIDWVYGRSTQLSTELAQCTVRLP